MILQVWPPYIRLQCELYLEVTQPCLLQVFKSLKEDNWTLNCEKDLTGPYGFDDTKYWMAFDDATSLVIKTKYAILRNLGGMALFSIDADDSDNICGQGEHSLLKSIFKTMTKLDRKPRQLVVHSLEQDLIGEIIKFVCLHIRIKWTLFKLLYLRKWNMYTQ